MSDAPLLPSLNVGPAKRGSRLRSAVRFVLGAFVIFMLASQVETVFRQASGFTYISALKDGEAPDRARTGALHVGWIALAVALVIVVVLVILMMIWSPRSRTAYAFRYSLWSLVVSLTWVAIPTALWLGGVPGQSPYTYYALFGGSVLIWVLFSLALFPLGFWLGEHLAIAPDQGISAS